MQRRVPWIAGIVFGVVSIGVGVMTPGFDVEPTTGSVGLVDDVIGNAEMRAAAVFVSMLAIPLLIVFAAEMRGRLAGWTADAFMAGAVLIGVAAVVTGGVAQMAASIEGVPEEAVLARLIVVYDWNTATLFIPGILAMGASAAIGGAGDGGLPRWLVVGATIVAVSSLAPWIGVPILVMWVLAASVTFGFVRDHVAHPVEG